MEVSINGAMPLNLSTKNLEKTLSKGQFFHAKIHDKFGS